MTNFYQIFQLVDCLVDSGYSHVYRPVHSHKLDTTRPVYIPKMKSGRGLELISQVRAGLMSTSRLKSP